MCTDVFAAFCVAYLPHASTVGMCQTITSNDGFSGLAASACHLAACTSPPVLSNANAASCPIPLEHGKSCNLTCLPGYSPEGPPRAACSLGILTVTGATPHVSAIRDEGQQQRC
jgi:hypothetical protein